MFVGEVCVGVLLVGSVLVLCLGMDLEFGVAWLTLASGSCGDCGDCGDCTGW